MCVAVKFSALQKISAQMYTDLAHRSTSGMAEVLWDYAKHAQRYLHIIERFGRFPHRNTVLNRTSTPSESAYLERDTHTGSLH